MDDPELSNWAEIPVSRPKMIARAAFAVGLLMLDLAITTFILLMGMPRREWAVLGIGLLGAAIAGPLLYLSAKHVWLAVRGGGLTVNGDGLIWRRPWGTARLGWRHVAKVGYAYSGGRGRPLSAALTGDTRVVVSRSDGGSTVLMNGLTTEPDQLAKQLEEIRHTWRVAERDRLFGAEASAPQIASSRT